jgi:hypothetical protein
LFIAGFLGDGLRARLVDIDYYISMGGSAYAALSQSKQHSRRDRALVRVFAELAENFPDFVDVLTDLREDARRGQEDLLRLYEIWTKTGSRRAARLLRSRGIEPQQNLRQRQKPH